MSVRGSTSLVSNFRAPLGRRVLRYSMVSVICLPLSEALLILFNGPIGWSAGWSSTMATALVALPAYYLYRQWVWNKRGKSHLWKEVAPFWLTAIIGWAFATYSVRVAESVARTHHVSSTARVALVAATYVAAYGVLWVAKFVLFDKVLFTRHAGAAPLRTHPTDAPSAGSDNGGTGQTLPTFSPHERRDSL